MFSLFDRYILNYHGGPIKTFRSPTFLAVKKMISFGELQLKYRIWKWNKEHVRILVNI